MNVTSFGRAALLAQTPAKIRVSEYVDYRLFLADYMACRKLDRGGFSFRSFGQKAGVSPSLLKDILNHRQNLSVPVMLKYASAMGLSALETEYFTAMVGYNNAKLNADKNAFLNEMMRLRGRSPVRFLESKQYEYFTCWYHAVVREMVTAMGFGDNAKEIAAKILPAVTVGKVRKSIRLLKDLKFIRQNESGAWISNDKLVSSEYEIQSVALKQYHDGVLQCARKALDTVTSENREFQGMTLCATQKTYDGLKQRIRTFTDEILRTVAAEPEEAGVVFQFNVHQFPFFYKDHAK